MTDQLGERMLGDGVLGGGSRSPQKVVATDDIADLHLGQILQFYEITTADGNITRVVDFGDPQAGAALGQVTYDGDEYTSVHISRANISESTDSALPEIALTVVDYDRSVVAFVNDNDGLVGATVDLHVITYENIGTPSLATNYTFRVAKVQAMEGPSRVTVTLSDPAFKDHLFPRMYFNRRRCFNEWHRRFDHDNTNYCNFPSDDFEIQTAQDFRSSAATETSKEHGWYSLNGDEPSTWESNLEITGNDSMVLRCTFIATGTVQWVGTTLNAPFCYKKISATDDASVDVITRLSWTPDVAGDIAGIVILDADDQDNWIFAGGYHNGTNDYFYIRVTEGGSTTNYDQGTGYTANVFRIKRDPDDNDDWYFYYGAETFGEFTESDPDSGWTAAPNNASVTTNSANFTGALHVGLVAGQLSAATSTNLQANFDYFRFFRGGVATCDRTLTACNARDNSVQFNGYLGIPDNVIRW
jgi:hypothetical protein